MHNNSFTKKDNISSLNNVVFKKNKQETSINIHTAF